MKNKNYKSFNRQSTGDSKAKKNNTPTTIPIHSYWFFAIMVTIASSMFVKHGSVDILFNATNSNFAFHHIVIILSIILLLFGFIYWSQRQLPLTTWMTNLHSMLTLTVLGSFYMTCFQEKSWNITPVLFLGIGMFILAQLVLSFNIFLAKKKSTDT